MSELEHVAQILPEHVNEEKGYAPISDAVSRSSDKGFNVLIVDDDTDILECYRMLFELEGYHTEAVSTPFEALEKAKMSKFDFAILDYRLPNMRGDELALRLLEVNGAMKLVFISGHSDAEESIARRGLNISYFMKPVNPESLLGIARKACDGHVPLTVAPYAVALA